MLHAYPALRALNDADLCAATFAALCDNEANPPLVGICKRCGCEFEYVKQGRRPRVWCDDCLKYRGRPQAKHDPIEVGGATTMWVRCIHASELYRRGCWYSLEFVRSDVRNWLVSMKDFDTENVYRGTNPEGAR